MIGPEGPEGAHTAPLSGLFSLGHPGLFGPSALASLMKGAPLAASLVAPKGQEQSGTSPPGQFIAPILRANNV